MVLLGLGAAGCSDDAAACGEPASSFVVTQSSVDHTCLHVTDGPFGDVTAAANDAADGPLLENEHMLYTIALVDDGTGSYTGTVSFRPPFSATYVFNTSEDVPVAAVASDDKSAPCNAASQALENCQGLTHAELFTLEAKRTYLLRVGPTSSASIQAVVEEHIVAAN